MKILQLVTKRQFRGAELSAFHLSAKLIEYGHEIVWVGVYPLVNDTLDLPGAFQEDLPGNKKSFFNLKKALALKKIIITQGVDVIQANGAETIKYAVAASLLGAPKPIVYRNISQVGFWLKGATVRKMFSRFLLSKAKQIISVGDASKKDMISTFPAFENKTIVINRGVPVKPLNKTEASSNLRARYGLSPDTKVLLWAGAFSKEKNIGMLLEIMKQPTLANAPVVLIMAGRGVLFEEIKDIVEEEFNGKIILAGYQKNLETFYAGSDLFLLTSLIEGVPGVILEAAVQHTPTVSVNVGGVDEVIIQRETGIIVNGYDAKIFAKEVMDLLADAPLCMDMGNKAFALVKDKFDEEKNTRKFVEVYQKLMQKK